MESISSVFHLTVDLRTLRNKTILFIIKDVVIDPFIELKFVSMAKRQKKDAPDPGDGSG